VKRPENLPNLRAESFQRTRTVLLAEGIAHVILFPPVGVILRVKFRQKPPSFSGDWSMTKTKGDFGGRVKELRERLHLTQEAMAETLGVSFATVNRWENGWTAPSKLALRQIDLLCKERRIAPLNSDKG
jgi:putative transcriptional regulator